MADLKEHFERINDLHDELDQIKSEISDALIEAKKAGYIPKALRRIVKLSRMDDDQRARFKEDEVLQREYVAKLDPEIRAVFVELEAGSTLDETAAKAGVSRSTAARLKAVSKNRKNDTTPPADDDASSQEMDE